MLDVAEGGGITGVIDQQVGVCRPEAEVGIAEPLLLAGGREDGDDGEVHHPALEGKLSSSVSSHGLLYLHY